MKRSERYYRNARASAWQATTAFMASLTSACWVPGAMIDNSQGASPIWLFALITISAASGTWAIYAAREAMTLYRLGTEEELHEARRAIRPRI